MGQAFFCTHIFYCIIDDMRTQQMAISKVQKSVKRLLAKEKTGHNIEHVMRVYRLAIDFCERENVNQEIVAIAALLHDVDDYKIFGEQSAEELTNARKIMKEAGIDDAVRDAVVGIIKDMGYSKLLAGVCPSTFEGKIVSDADMCDAIGAIGILRWHQYVIAHGADVFDPRILPVGNISSEEYKKQCASTGNKLVGGNPVNHFFDKLLKLKKMMMTQAGRDEAEKRQQVMVDFLYEFFRENDEEKWIRLLDDYLREPA